MGSLRPKRQEEETIQHMVFRAQSLRSTLCEKRTVGATTTRRFGVVEPVAFLHAWRDIVHFAGPTHVKSPPKADAVAVKMAEPGNPAVYRHFVDTLTGEIRTG